MKFTHGSGSRPLDGYTIKRGIGRGGFGEVYYALSDGGKEVALKLISGNVDIELRGMSQCLNFKHPHLVEIYDLRTDRNGDHWVVMEYVTGETLNTVLNRHPNGLAPELARQWFTGLAAAIGYLHDHGVVHRDLKPGNVFLETGQIKVGDFGLARYISGSQHHSLTQSIGTVHYMAPEISTGNYNKQIDIYAAGILMYEMLTGHVPFDGESAGEILMKHLTTPPDLTNVPGEFRKILDRALSKNPAHRFPHMADMANEVAALGTSAPPALKPPPLPHPPLAAKPVLPPVMQPTAPNHVSSIPPTLLVAEEVFIPFRIRMSEVAGSMLLAVLFAVLLCVGWAAVLQTNNLTKIAPYFFLTLACAWAVLLPAKMWSKRVEDSWKRRVALMTLGLGIGGLALWLEGHEIPALVTAEARAGGPNNVLADANEIPAPPSVQSTWHRGGWLFRRRDVPIAASYLTYFGLAFFLVRWWKMADRRRTHRFSLWSVFVAGLSCWILTLLIWPSDENAKAALIDPTTVLVVPVMAAVIIQLVSPWEAPTPRKSRKLRLANA